MLDTNDLAQRHLSSCSSRSPRSSRAGGRTRVGALALAALAAAAVFAPRDARAENVSPTGKGIAGGALLGGEIVVFGEALFGVRSTAAYALGAAGGAVAGGVGGYFLEQSVDDGHVPSYILAGGLALFIPALVIALDQTRYVPAENAREDRPLTNAPPANPGQPGGSSVVGAPGAVQGPNARPPSGETPPPGATPPVAPGGTPGGSTTSPEGQQPPSALPAGGTTPAPGAGGGGTPRSLLDLTGGDMRVGLPLPDVRPVFTVSECKALAVKNPGTEVRFPVVSLTF